MILRNILRIVNQDKSIIKRIKEIRIMPDMRPPSEKQYDYAKVISEELEVPLPDTFSKSAYSHYISHYEKRYKLSMQKYHDEEEDEEEY